MYNLEALSSEGDGAFLFQEAHMKKEEEAKYEETKVLRDILKRTLEGKKFRLDCGHHITFGHLLGNDITIYNGKKLKIICSQCGH
jgi:hypothetical protein